MPEVGYRIGEVASMLGLKPYVLRYWETEFPQILPKRTKTKQRLYTSKSIELLKTIQNLLHKQGLTIEGARKIINQGCILKLEKKSKVQQEAPSIKTSTSAIVKELEELRILLLGKLE